MRYPTIKTHLNSYVIWKKRATTIAHAFASAVAPVDGFDERRIREAMVCLGQDPDQDLRCVYCDGSAQTWDHLVGLVKDSELRGYGHQLGNLVPSCRDCNSRKGGKDVEAFLDAQSKTGRDTSLRKQRLREYQARYATEIDQAKFGREKPDEWRRFKEIQAEILKLMKEADELALQLRSVHAVSL